MAVFDTPITTNEQNLQKVLAQKLPVAIYLYNTRQKSLEDVLAQQAKDNVGKLLIARVDVAENPHVHEQYGHPSLPALLTMNDGTLRSKAEWVQPSDLREHIDYLLGRGPMPQMQPPPTPQAARSTVSAAPVHVTDSSFQQMVLNSDLPVLVDFWADWCGPCHMIAPHLDRMAGEFVGKVKIAKLNVDENPRISGQYGIQAIPTYITFKNGKQVARQSGADPTLVRNLIQQVISA